LFSKLAESILIFGKPATGSSVMAKFLVNKVIAKLALREMPRAVHVPGQLHNSGLQFLRVILARLLRDFESVEWPKPEQFSVDLELPEPAKCSRFQIKALVRQIKAERASR
jgi:hypothetical protein